VAEQLVQAVPVAKFMALADHFFLCLMESTGIVANWIFKVLGLVCEAVFQPSLSQAQREL
jgi:hypothetical protein